MFSKFLPQEIHFQNNYLKNTLSKSISKKQHQSDIFNLFFIRFMEMRKINQIIINMPLFTVFALY